MGPSHGVTMSWTGKNDFTLCTGNTNVTASLFIGQKKRRIVTKDPKKSLSEFCGNTGQ